MRGLLDTNIVLDVMLKRRLGTGMLMPSSRPPETGESAWQ